MRPQWLEGIKIKRKYAEFDLTPKSQKPEATRRLGQKLPQNERKRKLQFAKGKEGEILRNKTPALTIHDREEKTEQP